MKKFYFFVFVILFSSLIFVSCNDNIYMLSKENISEIRQNILVYNDENIYATFMSGKRELNYKQDGVAGESVDFAIINLEFKSNDYVFNQKSVLYDVKINDVTYNGQMVNNPYDNTFVVDLQIEASDVDICEIVFEVDGEEISATLVNISKNWNYDCFNVLQIASKDLKTYLMQDVLDNKLLAEVFVKVVYNDKFSSDYLWYIQFVTINGNVYTEIISPITGEIMAKNIK